MTRETKSGMASLPSITDNVHEMKQKNTSKQNIIEIPIHNVIHFYVNFLFVFVRNKEFF